ncbi:hypothetical protein L7F22_063419 [Adiantum nelumboides]|nr:hypothetical protein [Adiantum nelumboides]MCO5609196.1 hypothetical protein [Adiantum nelumboides]
MHPRGYQAPYYSYQTPDQGFVTGEQHPYEAHYWQGPPQQAYQAPDQGFVTGEQHYWQGAPRQGPQHYWQGPPRLEPQHGQAARHSSRPCRFFITEGGCKKGSNCKFEHVQKRPRPPPRELQVQRAKKSKADTLTTATHASTSQVEQSDLEFSHVSSRAQKGIQQLKRSLFELAWEQAVSATDKEALALFAKEEPRVPMFQSKIEPYNNVAMLKGSPSLLIHDIDNMLGPESQQIHELMRSSTSIVLLGTSGCGKTRCIYELLSKHFGLVLVCAVKQNGGSADVEDVLTPLGLEGLENLTLLQRHERVKDITRILLWARLGILKFFLEQNPKFSAYQWLLFQARIVCPVTRDLLFQLAENMCTLWIVDKCDVRRELSRLFQDVIEMLPEEAKFLIALDEAQVLLRKGEGKFGSDSGNGKPDRALFTPVYDCLLMYASFYERGCVLLSGTGLGLLSGEDAIMSRAAKFSFGGAAFVNFGGWEDAMQVRAYMLNFVSVSEEESTQLFETFRGRYRPLVSFIELLMQGGKTVEEVSCSLVEVLTSWNTPSSFYESFVRLRDNARINKLGGVNILATLSSILFHYMYSGTPYVVRNKHELNLMEYGIGRFVQIDEDKWNFERPSLRLQWRGVPAKVCMVLDEPLVMQALGNFYTDEGLLEQKYHDSLRSMPSESSRGYAWEGYLTREFQRWFDGSKCILDSPLFGDVKIKHPVFEQTVTLVKPDSDGLNVTPIVQRSSNSYNLADYLKSDPKTSPPFFICEQEAGPDLCFRVKFADGTIRNSFVQAKLRLEVKRQDEVVETTNPVMFYTVKKKERQERQIREDWVDERQQVIEACKHGILRFVVMYPAKIKRGLSSKVIGGSAQLGPQLVCIVGAQNAHGFLEEDHIEFLDNLKNVVQDETDVVQN